MALINNIENEYPNRNMDNDFKIPMKLENPDIYEHINNPKEFNELEIEIIKEEKIELDRHVKQELLLNIQEENPIKKEENQENEAEETTESSIENQNHPAQDIERNLELYADHEINDELVIGPVVLQPQIISGVLKDEVAVEDSSTYSMPKPPDQRMCDSESGDLILHKRMRRTQSRSCYACDKTYRSIILLKIHMEMHKKTVYACKICDKRYKSPYTLSRHCELPHKEQITTYPCRICTKTYYDLISLISHFNAVHQRRYECDICGKTMSTKGNVVRHIIGHGKRETYSCQVCNKQFARKRYLQRHENTHQIKHTPEYENQCVLCQKCGKKIRDYRHHARRSCVMRTDNKEKAARSYSRRFACDVCKREFMYKESLRDHIESIHCNVKYSCDICKKTYSSRRALKRHVDEHERGHKCFECDICKKKFTRSWTLRRHELMEHTDDA